MADRTLLPLANPTGWHWGGLLSGWETRVDARGN